MTDTGQVPGEGLPESAGMVEQPGAPAHGAYTYLSESPAEDEELLLPGAQGAWGNEVPPPTPEPVVEAVHEPGPHETGGRDSGSVDLTAVRLPSSVPASPILSVPHDPAVTPAPRRPLHLGPPIPDASTSPVRSLADRGPAGAPVRQPGLPSGAPEYLDAQPLREAAPQPAAPWGVPGAVPQAAPVAQVAAQAPAAETVVPMPEPMPEPVPVQAAAGQPAPQQAAVPTPEPSGVAPVTTGVVAAGAAAEQQVPAVAGAQPVHAYGPQGMAQPVGGGVPAPAAEPVAAPVAQAPEGTHGAVPGARPEPGAVPEAPQLHVLPGQGAAPVQAAAPAGVTASEAPQGPEAGGAPGEPVVAAQGAPVAEGAQVAAETAAAAQAPEGIAPENAVVEDVAPQAAVSDGIGTDALGPEAVGPEAAAEAVVAEPGQPVPSAAGPVVPEAQPVEPVAAQQPAPEGVVAEQAVAEGAVPQQTVTEQAAVEPVAAEAAVAQSAVAGQGVAEGVAAEPAGAAEAVVPEPEPESVPAPEAGAPESVPVPEAVAAESAQPQAADPNAPAQAPQPAESPAPVAEAPQAQPVPAPGAEEPAPDAPMDEADTAAAVPQTETGTPETVDGAETPAAPQGQSAPPVEVPLSGPQTQGTAPEVSPQAEEPSAADHTAEPAAEQRPLGEFVAVDGQVPTTPHLAPTPPHPLVLPVQDQGESAPAQAATVPAPREAEPGAVAEPHPDVVQQAEDLETRAADQEESTAPVAEARQSTGPAAPAYDDAEREAVLKVMRERRDIRNGFRSDPIPHEVLLRVLEAAHTAPSVGHSQPWDFVVIRSADTRRTMHELAMRQREAYAKSLPKGRAKQFKELKIEAILDTPVNIVVTADPTRGGRHTLGRHTQPQMAPYSAALAVENLWLAARAEGLGVGWVSFFDEREMVRALGLPEHLEVIAYLCVGYVDEFPDEPELMQAGWSKRRPLSWVVHEETYGRRALPGEDPHDLLAETVASVRPLDAKALGEAWERQKRMTKPAGALGMLEIISAQLSGLSRQCPPPIPEPAAVAIFAGDHGVHAQGVTPWPQEVTAQMVANFLGGGAVCNAFAGQVGAEVCVVDVGVASELPATPGLLPRKVRAGTSDMTTGPAMTREEAKQAIEVGIETARDLVAAGNKALLTGEMGIANTTASAALISVFTGADPAEVTGRGTGINDETLARKTEVVRRALELHQPDPADPIGVLAAVGGFEHAAMVGLLLGGASLRTPVILDGVSAGAAALVARAIAPEVLAACIAGHRSAEPGHVAALNKLGLRPLVDLDLRLGEGTGALLALPLVQSTARAMHEVATFDSAGVTEK
ncbi:nicotinate-nucleotide--dimethylbenzimidazole phosphoribosyltransferase [Streptomyces sp. NPDC007162]|uniref:nicotinate-nucleotide--dimethylbenzimidazole phosphoribosyltransferase n=1 Tax=Streptomyces sp. NPDC007162 TaxID=3156917 RepID=UPI0034044C32